MAKNDLTKAPRDDAAKFVEEMRRLKPAAAGRGRLIFALDATGSRERSWDRACDVQAAMFLEAEALGE